MQGIGVQNTYLALCEPSKQDALEIHQRHIVLSQDNVDKGKYQGLLVTGEEDHGRKYQGLLVTGEEDHERKYQGLLASADEGYENKYQYLLVSTNKEEESKYQGIFKPAEQADQGKKRTFAEPAEADISTTHRIGLKTRSRRMYVPPPSDAHPHTDGNDTYDLYVYEECDQDERRTQQATDLGVQTQELYETYNEKAKRDRADAAPTGEQLYEIEYIDGGKAVGAKVPMQQQSAEQKTLRGAMRVGYSPLSHQEPSAGRPQLTLQARPSYFRQSAPPGISALEKSPLSPADPSVSTLEIRPLAIGVTAPTSSATLPNADSSSSMHLRPIQCPVATPNPPTRSSSLLSSSAWSQMGSRSEHCPPQLGPSPSIPPRIARRKAARSS